MPKAHNGSKKGRRLRQVTALENLNARIAKGEGKGYTEEQIKRMVKEQATLQSRI